MLKVAIICHSLVSAGGTERVVSTLSSLLSKKFDVYEISFDKSGAKRYFNSPASFISLGPSLQLPLVLRPISYLYDAYRLHKAKRILKISISISNLWRADLINVLSLGGDKKISICHINIINNKTNSKLIQFLPLVSFIFRKFDAIVSVSRPLGDEISKLYRIENSKSHVIHNCVEKKSIVILNRTKQRVRIVWCGRFVEEKNVLALIEIFQK
jgi:glycosyltransferase involved in cell wall biosynthesis